MTDRTVRTRFEAVIGQWQAAMAQMGASTKATALSVDSLVGKSKGSFKSIGMDMLSMGGDGMAAAAGVAVVTAAVLKLGKDGVDAYVNLADRVRNYQRIAGGTAEDASRMVEAFHAVGITSEEGATAVFRLSQNLNKNADALRAAGVVVTRDKQGNVDLNRTLLSLSDAYRNITDPQQRNVLMMQALSRGAIVLAPLLARNREEIQAFWDAAGRHGLIMSQADLDQAREFKLQVHELGDAWKGIEVQIGRGVVPVLTELVGKLETAVDYIRRFSGFVTETKHTGDETLLSRVNKDLNNFFQGNSAINAALAKAQAQAQKAGEPTTSAEVSARNARENLQALSDLSGVAQPRLQALADTMGIDLATATDKEKQSLQDAAVKLNAAVSPTERLAAVTGVLTDAYATGAEKVNAYKAAVDAILGSQLTAESATITLHQSLQTLADELATGQHVDETVRQYQDRLGSDLVTVVGNVKSAMEAMVANGQIASTDVAGQQAFIVQALQKVEDQYPILRTEIDAYIAKLGQIPGTVTTIAEFVDAKGNPLTDQSFEAWALAQSGANAGGQLGVGTVGAPATGHANDKQNGEQAINAYLKALYQERIDITDNMYAAGKTSIQEYLRALDGELAGEKAYTNEWMATQQKKQQALQQLADFYKGVIDHQRELQDNEYTMGVLGKDEYLALLEERLKGLEKYSNAWTQIMQQIQQVEGAALDAQIKIIQAVEQQRLYDQAFYALAGQRQLSASWQQGITASLSPSQGGSSSSVVNSTNYTPSFVVTTADPVKAATTANQQMRDYAALAGV